MDITPQLPEGRQIVRSYGDGRFRIGANAVYQHPVLVLPERTLPWMVTDLTSISLDSLAPVLEHQPGIEILLVGGGKTWRPLPSDLKAALRVRGLSCDVMDTGAACRTFNVLLLEDRRVAAALIPV